MNARVLLLALAVFAAPFQSLDDAARRAVLETRRPWLDAPMHGATEYGKPLLLATAVVAALSGAAGRAFLAEGVVVLVPVNALVELTKYVTWRTRPDGTRRRTNASFPSSHAANAFAVAVLLARRWRRLAPAWFALAAVVAWSRLYLDRHWASDVLVGALVGTVVAWAMLRWWSARRARQEPVQAA